MNKVIIISVLFLIIFSLLFLLLKPYESINEVRRSSNPVTLVVEYINVTGDPGCTKLYTLNSAVDDMQEAVFPALPDDLPAPDDGEYAYHSNKFELTGFTYDWVLSNKITGSEQRRKSRRFDVIKWEVIPPYSVWVLGDGEPGVEQKQEPLVYEHSSPDKSAVNFKMENYVDCLAGQ